jgi:hypothetical protein
MKNLRNANCAIAISILITASGCSKPQKITHLDFLDQSGYTYLVGDTNQIDPLKTMAIYYLINKENYSSVKFNLIDSFVAKDEFIRKNVVTNNKRLTAIFLKTSENTKNLIKYKSGEMLARADNDVIVEYEWIDGEFLYKSYRNDSQK